MKTKELQIGKRYRIKVFGSVREVILLDFQDYSAQKEKPRRIWSVREIETGKNYTVFTARKFLAEAQEVPAECAEVAPEGACVGGGAQIPPGGKVIQVVLKAPEAQNVAEVPTVAG